VGLASRGFEIILDLLERTMKHVKSCECEEGCPSCIHSPKCGSGNKPLDKQAAVLILEGLLGHIPLSRMTDEKVDPGPMPLSAGNEAVIEKKKPRLVYFDLETRKTAQDVGGWHNTHLMRVSVAVLFDSLEDRFVVYEEDGIEDLLKYLDRADLVIGFNNKKFDYSVLGAYTNRDLAKLSTFDILEDIFKRLGFRLGLDHLAKETLGRGKTAHGLQAVDWFHRGEMKKLTEYCRQDVAVTRDLFHYGLKNGHLIYREKRSGTRLRLRVDWKLDELIK
jgi:DEAD/DEAH box helicase domain-containing protein